MRNKLRFPLLFLVYVSPLLLAKFFAGATIIETPSFTFYFSGLSIFMLPYVFWIVFVTAFFAEWILNVAEGEK